MAYSKDEVINFLQRNISIKNRLIDLSTGNIIMDLSVESFADLVSLMTAEIDRTKQVSALDAEAMTDEEADQAAGSYNETRVGSGKASGDITFGALELPSEGSPVYIPAGTIIQGRSMVTSSPITYSTAYDVVLSSTSPYNEGTGYYEASAAAVASVPGSASNVGVGYLNQLQTTIAGIAAVYNKNAITNGTDTEDKESLISRVNLKKQGRNLNSFSGLLNQVLKDSRVKEALVIPPDNEYSIRGPGKVDIYVRGDVIAQYIQQVTVMTKEQYLDSPPIDDQDNSITVTIDGVVYTENDNVFTYVKDESSIDRNSYIAHDKIVFTDTGYDLISDQTSYIITYNYNSLILDLQNSLQDNSNRYICGDVLVRATNARPVVMEFGFVPLAGYDKNTVITTLKTNIETYVDSLPLGTDLRKSNVSNIIENTVGVDYISNDGEFLQFHTTDETDQAKWSSDIIANPLEYFSVTDDTLIIG